MGDELKRKVRTRAGHKAYVTKSLGDIKNKNEDENEERKRIISIKSSLEEQFEAIKKLDEQVLDLLWKKEGVEDGEIAAEIEEAGILRAEIKTAIMYLDEQIGSRVVKASEKETVTNTETRDIRSKLPKLNVREFDGKPEQWQEFWDGFESAIYSNPKLSTIDKFSYLRGSPQGPARSAIAGFALSIANYDSAITLPKRRFGKKETIQRAHINELLNVAPVTSGRDAAKLRTFLDAIKSHHRGLQASDQTCAFCLGNHEHSDCTVVTSIADRKRLICKYGRCFICMKKGHLAINVMPIMNVLNVRVVIIGQFVKAKRFMIALQSVNAHLVGPAFQVDTETSVALQTAKAVLKGDSTHAKVRVIFDTGSHRSFVTKKAAKSAKLIAKRKEWVEISAFGQGTADKGLRNVFDLELVNLKTSLSTKIEAYEVDNIAQIKGTSVELVKMRYPHLMKLWFSDSCQAGDGAQELDIDVLIGADYLWCFQEGRTIRGERGEPVAVETSLGWVLSGPMKCGAQPTASSSLLIRQDSKAVIQPNDRLEDSLQKLWDFETLGIRETNEVHEALRDGIEFTGERYKVLLPWKEAHSNLPSNYKNCFRRLKGQLAKLKDTPQTLAEYDRIIKEQHELGIVERVSALDNADKVHYLPHHAVVRAEAKTTKVRVVYDASAKENKHSVSLNDCLHVGPALSPLLFDILLRFREKRVVLIGDIEKAFLNIEIKEKDRDCLRFLWVDDVTCEQVDQVVYKFCRVVFGVSSSPFLLNATLQQHIDRFEQKDAEFVRKMKEGFYVDDLVSGDKTPEKVFQLYEKAKQRLASGGFKLRKWVSSSKEVMDKIKLCKDPELEQPQRESQADDETYAMAMLGGRENQEVERVLGQQWNWKTDTLQFTFGDLVRKAEGMKAVSKRNVLSLLASLFDPLGIISPVVLSVKILFQDICKEKVGWDAELDSESKVKFMKWVNSLESVSELSVARCVSGPEIEIDRDRKYTLHGFADASMKAYCAVIYVVCQAGNDIQVRLLTSKTRVAPLKPQTIPRLELMSGRILAQLMDNVQHMHWERTCR